MITKGSLQFNVGLDWNSSLGHLFRCAFLLFFTLGPLGCLGNEFIDIDYDQTSSDGGHTSGDDPDDEDSSTNKDDQGATDKNSNEEDDGNEHEGEHDKDVEKETDPAIESDENITCNPKDEPTWKYPIKGILDQRCERCHAYEVRSYDNLQVWIRDGSLKYYTERYHYITGSERDTVLRWIDIGIPEDDCDVP